MCGCQSLVGKGRCKRVHVLGFGAFPIDSGSILSCFVLGPQEAVLVGRAVQTQLNSSVLVARAAQAQPNSTKLALKLV
eukprot:2212268-Alexandrium_andersonii.AAC.1